MRLPVLYRRTSAEQKFCAGEFLRVGNVAAVSVRKDLTTIRHDATAFQDAAAGGSPPTPAPALRPRRHRGRAHGRKLVQGDYCQRAYRQDQTSSWLMLRYRLFRWRYSGSPSPGWSPVPDH